MAESSAAQIPQWTVQRLVAVRCSGDRCNTKTQLIQYFRCFSVAVVAVAATTDGERFVVLTTVQQGQ